MVSEALAWKKNRVILRQLEMPEGQWLRMGANSTIEQRTALTTRVLKTRKALSRQGLPVYHPSLEPGSRSS